GWPAVESWDHGKQLLRTSVDQIAATVERAQWDESKIAAILLVTGIALVLLAIVVELLAALAMVSGRRSAFGSNALVQVALAAAVIIAVNFYSVHHYQRLDWSHDPQTGEPQFTLPKDIADQLRQLKGETLIVVYQRHKT